MRQSAFLILEDGTIFQGKSIGITGVTAGEVVFNTAMTGYQEILTDPSYTNQIITFTYPHIGNTGINNIDIESYKLHVKGIIIHNISLVNKHYQSKMNFNEYLKKNNIIGIMEIDTRKLTRKLRNSGTQYGCIVSAKKKTQKNIKQSLQNAKYESKINILDKVSTKNIYTWSTGTNEDQNNNYHFQKKELTFHVIVYDFGVKQNILKLLVDYGCYVTIVPYTTSIEKTLSLSPDGIILSNGPGDPRIYLDIIDNIKKLIATDIPIFGICLGHQLLALANSAKIIKMKFGHHGSNHPVQDLITKKVMITTQNHNFTIDKNNFPDNMNITHISLFDKTIQGIEFKRKNIFGFQGHPEASPGPNDSQIFFKKFIKNIKNYKKKII